MFRDFRGTPPGNAEMKILPRFRTRKSMFFCEFSAMVLGKLLYVKGYFLKKS